LDPEGTILEKKRKEEKETFPIFLKERKKSFGPA